MACRASATRGPQSFPCRPRVARRTCSGAATVRGSQVSRSFTPPSTSRDCGSDDLERRGRHGAASCQSSGTGGLSAVCQTTGEISQAPSAAKPDNPQGGWAFPGGERGVERARALACTRRLKDRGGAGLSPRLTHWCQSWTHLCPSLLEGVDTRKRASPLFLPSLCPLTTSSESVTHSLSTTSQRARDNGGYSTRLLVT